LNTQSVSISISLDHFPTSVKLVLLLLRGNAANEHHILLLELWLRVV
jgi:hypothetical protein